MAKDTTGRLHVTVKSGGKRKLSSKLWLERQLNDPYVAQAKRDGYRSRAAYKLLEIDDKHHFLKQGITVVDLGAAPGGWSYSAAKRGARVLAIDHGAPRGGALGHPLIEHRAEDAFTFHPDGTRPFDWLFCDLIEEPHQVMRQIALPWLSRGWCRRFVLNLKFGRVDPIGLLWELRAPDSPLSLWAKLSRIRHLFHDREEFTVVGTTSSGPVP